MWEAILDAIRKKLSVRGQTQLSVAEILGVDSGTVGRWLKGLRGSEQKTIDELMAYMRALDIKPGPYLGLNDPDNDYTRVPYLRARASMGGGSQENSPEIRSYLSFQTSWIHQKTINPGALVVVSAIGPSMEPTIPDGAVLLVDESRASDPVNNQIYFIRCDDNLYAKRLRVEDSKVVAYISDSNGHEHWLDGSENFEIIGKVLWFAKEL